VDDCEGDIEEEGGEKVKLSLCFWEGGRKDDGGEKGVLKV